MLGLAFVIVLLHLSVVRGACNVGTGSSCLCCTCGLPVADSNYTLTQCRLVNLPRIPSDFPNQMGTLALENGLLGQIQANAFQNYPYIYALNVVACQLTTVQGDAFQKSKFQSIHFNSNNMKTLPSTLFNGQISLQELDLRSNGVVDLPNGIFSGLTGLQKLLLHGNLLSSLPFNYFTDLSGLLQLTLSNNLLKSLSGEVFTGLGSLEVMDLFGNSISSLDPLTFSPLRSLLSLDLSGNKLGYIFTSVFASLTKLTKLTIQDAGLSGLSPYAFNGLQALTVLRLDTNSLSSIPDQLFSSLVALKTLSLSGNRITKLNTNSFAGLGVLTELDLSSNLITEFPTGVFSPLKSLTTLDLSENALSILLPSVFPTSLTTLSLDSNSIRTISLDAFVNQTALTTLSLDGNVIDCVDYGLASHVPIIPSSCLCSTKVTPVVSKTTPTTVSCSPAASSSSSSTTGIIIGAVVGGVFFLLLLLLLLLIYCRRKMKFKKEISNITKRMSRNSTLQSTKKGGKIAEPRRLDVSFIRILDVLGSGNFGEVCKGILTEGGSPGFLVAVKRLRSEIDSQKKEFLEEAVIMAQLVHDHIVGIIGVVYDQANLMVVLEYCEYGALNKYLQRTETDLKVKLLIAGDVASGLAYLSSLNFVHRDIAARNVLLSSERRGKIADFGMSRETNEEYYSSRGGQLPVRWTAPEALEEKKFSCRSDCWSYGILLYELWTKATLPYEGWSNQKVWVDVLAGYRLPCPAGCPEKVYSRMILCWMVDPHQRPEFAELEHFFRNYDGQNLSLSSDPRRPVSVSDVPAEYVDTYEFSKTSSPDNPLDDPPTSPTMTTVNSLYHNEAPRNVQVTLNPLYQNAPDNQGPLYQNEPPPTVITVPDVFQESSSDQPPPTSAPHVKMDPETKAIIIALAVSDAADNEELKKEKKQDDALPSHTQDNLYSSKDALPKEQLEVLVKVDNPPSPPPRPEYMNIPTQDAPPRPPKPADETPPPVPPRTSSVSSVSELLPPPVPPRLSSISEEFAPPVPPRTSLKVEALPQDIDV